MHKLLSILGYQRIKQVNLAERAGISIWRLNRCLNHPSLYKFRKEEQIKIVRALGLPNDIDFKELFGEER